MTVVFARLFKVLSDLVRHTRSLLKCNLQISLHVKGRFEQAECVAEKNSMCTGSSTLTAGTMS